MVRFIQSVIIGFKCARASWFVLGQRPNATLKDINFNWNE